MNFMKVLSRLQVLRRGASRSYTSHYFQNLSVQSDRKTSLPCRAKPIFMKYSTFKAILARSFMRTPELERSVLSKYI